MSSPTAQLEKLQNLINLLNESLTKEDFVKAFEGVINYIKKIDQRNSLEVQQITETLGALFKKLKTNTLADFQDLKKQTNDSIATQLALVNKKLNEVRDGRDGRDGKDADEAKITAEILAKVPQPIPAREQLESLSGDDRLDISAIKGLEDYADTVKKVNRPIAAGGGRGMQSLPIDLSSLLDGSTKTFPLGTHFGIVEVGSSSTPFHFRNVIDYKAVGKNIVFTDAIDAAVSLATGQTLIVTVLK